MHCIVTAGPTYQPIDDVRRLTNFSTGKLGTKLAGFLLSQGHEVTLLRGYYATFRDPMDCGNIREFSTPQDLLSQLTSLRNDTVNAVFHAAAVGDFEFGKAWIRSPTGALKPISAKKLPTRQEGLLVELTPTPKIIKNLRGLFPEALIVGWKYEANSDRNAAIELGKQQISENRTDVCVVNGPAYGDGFGISEKSGAVQHAPNSEALFEALGNRLRSRMESA